MSALSNHTRVTRLYRHSLKTMLSWAVQRDIFYTERDRIRRQFEANASLSDVGVIEKTISDATLVKYAHPDPYIIPYYTGGSKYARNPPVHPDAQMIADFGREDYVVPGKH